MSRKLLLAGAIAAGFVLGATGAMAFQGILPWSRVGWSEWQKYSPESRQAWADGFLAGAALGQSPDTIFADSTRLAAWMTGRPAGRRFPYGSNLYLARLQDWYYWENHRGAPVWRGITSVNQGLGDSAR